MTVQSMGVRRKWKVGCHCQVGLKKELRSQRLKVIDIGLGSSNVQGQFCIGAHL